ncbi:hypothetical protein AB0A74_09675 [Saccharothrix sp. NPDC042600]|uniref:hypothetical protein n=1 Tax=Saccharothrix TaxID=2071 RepID=UPI0033CDAD76|nr:hypothetical protein GCM10017745_35710 [Saccharothrix mutabilis subsp. capreolus]
MQRRVEYVGAGQVRWAGMSRAGATGATTHLAVAGRLRRLLGGVGCKQQLINGAAVHRKQRHPDRR